MAETQVDSLTLADARKLIDAHRAEYLAECVGNEGMSEAEAHKSLEGFEDDALAHPTFADLAAPP
jgi:hypothetical protein